MAATVAAPVAGLVDDAVIAEYPEDLYHYDAIATGVEGFDAIGPAEIELFHQQGYLVVNHAFSPKEAKDAIDGLVHLLTGEVPDFTGVMYEQAAAGIDVLSMSAEERQDYVRKFMWFTKHEARLDAMAHHPRLIDVVTRIMEEPPVLFQDMALLKPPHIGREKPWHQDHAYFDLSLNTLVMGVWIALDEATTENGCMIIVPGSHRQGPVVHFKRRDWQICDTDVKDRRARSRSAGARRHSHLPQPDPSWHACQQFRATSPRSAIPLSPRKCAPDHRRRAYAGFWRRS